MENQEKIIITSSQLTERLATLAVKAFFALIPVFIYAVVQIIRFGNQIDYLLLIVGCILSIIGIMGHVIAERTYGVKKQKSYLAMLLIFSGFLPWLFGSYLVFISGFWSLRKLADGFSTLIILKAILFIFLGTVVVSKMHQITEIGRLISKGTFIIEDDNSCEHKTP